MADPHAAPLCAIEGTLTFEDAPPGVGAARGTGTQAVAPTTTMPTTAFANFGNLRHAMADFVGFELHHLTPREQHHA